MKHKKTLRTCKNGHHYYKSSDCIVCPICEDQCKSENGLFISLAAPARRALENEGIETLQTLSKYSEMQILELHGMGKTSIPKLMTLLKTKGLKFKTEDK